jgi:uncharacterized protein YcaQ
MPAPMTLSQVDARRLSVLGQMLASPRPAAITDVVTGLGAIQMDPTSAVARTEHLVLWSRLGRRFRIAELERMLWEERSLFEYWVEIVPTSDFAVHRESMRRYPGGPRGDLKSRQYIASWLKANAAFRRYVLRELRLRGPLRARDLEDRVAHGWHSGGWTNDGRSVATLLDILWNKGEIMIVGRDGQQRLWDLTERSLPVDQPRPPQRQIARRLVESQLRARGVAPVARLGWAFDGRAPGWERALRELTREGIAVRVSVEGLRGDTYVHAELLERPFRGRTTLLSPFDDLIHDRDRTEALFRFHFRLEIYVPKAKRRFGYFVLPILHGDRLIGRIDPKFDRKTGTLIVSAVFAETDAPASAGRAIAKTIDDLAAWRGATDIAYGRTIPAMWRRALRG